MSRRQPPVVVALIIMAVATTIGGGGLLAACSRHPHPPSPPSSSRPSPPSAPTQPPPAMSPFTGLSGGVGNPVLAVKIDNAAQARPHTGLTQADLVYVEPVEGGLSRILAVFSSRIPDTVGPVRSARESDLELLRQFGRPALGFSGAAPELLPLIGQASVVSASPDQTPAAYFRGRGPAPHNLFAHPAQLLAGATDASQAKDIGLRFGDAPPGGTPTQTQTVRYPAAQTTFDWSAGDGRWLVSMDGAPLMATEGGQVGAATVVIQYVPVHDSQLHDVKGNVSPFAETVGAGNALVLRDGQAYEARWSRPTPDGGTSFTLPSGQPMPFAPGPVWTMLTPA